MQDSTSKTDSHIDEPNADLQTETLLAKKRGPNASRKCAGGYLPAIP